MKKNARLFSRYYAFACFTAGMASALGIRPYAACFLPCRDQGYRRRMLWRAVGADIASALRAYGSEAQHGGERDERHPR